MPRVRVYGPYKNLDQSVCDVFVDDAHHVTIAFPVSREGLQELLNTIVGEVSVPFGGIA